MCNTVELRWYSVLPVRGAITMLKFKDLKNEKSSKKVLPETLKFGGTKVKK